MDPMYITLIVLAITAAFFMSGKVRADLVALCALLSLMLFDDGKGGKILSPEEALAGFSSSVVIMMVGLFVVGAGIFRTGLAKMISSRILKLAGQNENMLFVLIMLVTASIGAFVSNTGTVAVMLPIVVSMAAGAHINPRRYLMPLAFASSMGLFTLISTPPNLVIQEIITKEGLKPLSFFSFAPVGAICLTVGIVVLFFLSKYLVSKKDDSEKKKKQGKSLAELAEEYSLSQQMFQAKVKENSLLLDKTLSELKITTYYDISISRIVHTKRKGFRKIYEEELAGPNSIIRNEDILYCIGKSENIQRFATENKLILEEKQEKILPDFQESGLAEVFILPTSRLINQSISEIRFREEYGVNVLGIQRNKEYQMTDITGAKLHSGDALLVQGTWEHLANLADRQEDLILVGQPLEEASKVMLNQKAPIAASIMLLMVVAMVFNIIPSVAAVLIAAILMVVTGCLRNIEEAYKSINWESIVLIASMMPMATAFNNTGAASLISGGLISQLGDAGPYALLGGIYLCTSVLTLFISNTATAVLFAPIAMKAAIGMEVSPYPFMFAVAVSASMCFASPFSTPPNALVMNAGRYSFMDYVKVGLPLQIIMGIVMVALLPLLFGF